VAVAGVGNSRSRYTRNGSRCFNTDSWFHCNILAISIFVSVQGMFLRCEVSFDHVTVSVQDTFTNNADTTNTFVVNMIIQVCVYF
jgi:hypothetical protein